MGSSTTEIDILRGGSRSCSEGEEKVVVVSDMVRADRKEKRREKEKERTKLRERRRRAITSKILAGLRQHGNYNLPIRADINDVIKALAREAGWAVEADGTIYRSTVPCSPVPPANGNSVFPAPLSSSSQGQPPSTVTECDIKPAELVRLNESHTLKTFSKPGLQSYSANLGGKDIVLKSDTTMKAIVLVEDQVRQGIMTMSDQALLGTPYIPVYVVIPLNVFEERNQLIDLNGLKHNLSALKSATVDGVMVECCWGLVEREIPQQYDWSNYTQLFSIIREAGLKLQVVMSFHGYFDTDLTVSLPIWVLEIGKENPDIYFTDQKGRRNVGCLTWGVDKERVLAGRTGLEVYYDFMRNFRQTFNQFFEENTIVSVEIGLGIHGELQYPSHAKQHGWKYPGIGEFQCYDKYLQKSLKAVAVARGHPDWGKGPSNAGHYNSCPQDALFFCDGCDYDSYYGRFFLQWYSQMLIDHGERVLSVANLIFEGTMVAIKISGIHWWYKTSSHPAELTAGFYNSCNRDGYSSIMKMLAKQNAGVKFVFVEPDLTTQRDSSIDAMTCPGALQWQVLNAAWDANVLISSENTYPCYGKEDFNKFLRSAKPRNDPDGHHWAYFTYSKLSPALFEKANFLEFERFVKGMHGFCLS